MLITREADYAIRLVRGLADGQIHPTKQICEEEEIPWKFAYKILKKLKDASIVESISGVYGGCRLTADLREVSLYDMITAIEDRQYLNDCMLPGYECKWVERKQRPCKVCKALADIQKDLDERLAGYKMADLIQDLPKKQDIAQNEKAEAKESGSQKRLA